MTYEYRITTYPSNTGSQKTEVIMNNMGQDGWELVGVTAQLMFWRKSSHTLEDVVTAVWATEDAVSKS